MDIILIVIKQTAIMFLYMLAGYLLIKSKKLTVEGGRGLAVVLVWLIIPVVIINSFCIECTREKLIELGLSALLGAIALGLAMLVSRLVFPKKHVEDFAAAFSNAGFVGIPLVRAVVGEDAVFFLVGFIGMLNIMQTTYGMVLLSGNERKIGWRDIVINPMLFGVTIGLVIFLSGAGSRMPSVLSGAISGIAATNSPVAMLVLGTYMAQGPVLKLFTEKDGYLVNLWRLLIIPAITIAIFALLPIDRNIKMAVLLSASAPVGANVAVYSQMAGADYPYACRLVVLSTLLSIIALPIVSFVGSLVF